MDILNNNNNNNNTPRQNDMVTTKNLIIDDFLKSMIKLISNVVVKVKMNSYTTWTQKNIIIFLQPIDSTDLHRRIKDQIHGSFDINFQKKSLNDLRDYIDEINELSSDQQLLKDFKTADVVIRLWDNFFDGALYLSVDGQSISRVKIDDKLMIDVFTSDASAQYLVNLSNKL